MFVFHPKSFNWTVIRHDYSIFPDWWRLLQRNSECTPTDWKKKDSLIDCQVHCRSKNAMKLSYKWGSRRCSCCSRSATVESGKSHGSDVYVSQGTFLVILDLFSILVVIFNQYVCTLQSIFLFSTLMIIDTGCHSEKDCTKDKPFCHEGECVGNKE